jgi:hypothetical protein
MLKRCILHGCCYSMGFVVVCVLDVMMSEEGLAGAWFSGR